MNSTLGFGLNTGVVLYLTTIFAFAFMQQTNSLEKTPENKCFIFHFSPLATFEPSTESIAFPYKNTYGHIPIFEQFHPLLSRLN